MPEEEPKPCRSLAGAAPLKFQAASRVRGLPRRTRQDGGQRGERRTDALRSVRGGVQGSVKSVNDKVLSNPKSTPRAEGRVAGLGGLSRTQHAALGTAACAARFSLGPAPAGHVLPPSPRQVTQGQGTQQAPRRQERIPRGGSFPARAPAAPSLREPQKDGQAVTPASLFTIRSANPESREIF